MSKLMTRAQREAFFRRLRELNPEPKTELEYRTSFELLIAVMLSAQATDVGVNKATRRLFPLAPDAPSMVDLGEERVRALISSIGLFRAKAKNVIETCRLLLERHGGEVPRERAALESLPGVGRKTANVVGAVIWQKEVMPVDTHVFRVSNRIGLTNRSKTPLQTELTLEKYIPSHLLPTAHHWLILHGRYVCTARAPKCAECGVSTWCRKYAEDNKRSKTE